VNSLTTETKGDIGYISGGNQKSHKVKATIATIPVATESLQVTTTVSGMYNNIIQVEKVDVNIKQMSMFYCIGGWLKQLSLKIYLVE
jgi:hypothetical protein